MKLDKIITLANTSVKLRFLAMERSLRAVGCNLPLLVIPYDDDTFELPENSTWWALPDVIHWLNSHVAHRTYRKYQCFLTENYQFVDSDVIFLQDPSVALANVGGFVTSCGQWRNSAHTVSPQSKIFFRQKYSLWQTRIFNSGQFACDRILYSFKDMKQTAESSQFKSTCIDRFIPEQPGVNMMVNATGVSIHNITLPPYNMESSWAGDYLDDEYDKLWNDENRPYLIHWAGCKSGENHKIDDLFLRYFSWEELEAWKAHVKMENARRLSNARGVKRYLKRVKKAMDIIIDNND